MPNEMLLYSEEDIIEEAKALFEANQLLRAINLLKKGTNQYPHESRFHYMLAECYHANNRMKRAIKHQEKAVDIDPQSFSNVLFMGQLYVLNGDLEKAETCATKALELGKESVEAFVLAGEVELKKEQHTRALDYISKAVEMEPEHFKASRLLTKVYLLDNERLDKVLKSIDYSETLSYEEEMEFDRAYAYCVQGQYDEARVVYQKLVHKNPNSVYIQKIHDLLHQERQEERDPAKKSVEAALDQLNVLTGLSQVKDKVNRIVKYTQFYKIRSSRLALEEEVKSAYHFAFLGNPGTGKTTVARILGDIFHSLGIIEKSEVVEVDRSDLVGEFVGQTAVKTKAVIDKAMGGVLFVDEAYALAPAGGGNDFGAEAIDTLLKAMEDNRDNLIVIFAGYNDEMRRLLQINPGLDSRINFQIQFEDYTSEELVDIAQSFAKSHHYDLTPEAIDAFKLRISERQVDIHFANARAVRNIIEDAIRERAYRLMDTDMSQEDLSILEPEDFGVNPDQLFGDDLDGLMEELHALQGLDGVKNQVQSIINYIRADKMRNEIGSSSSELMLHMAFLGNPGTGKTTIARLVSQILKAIGVLKKGHLVEVTRDDLVGGYVGQTGPKTLDKIKEAYGGVLFVDEAYSLAGSSDNDFGYEAISTLIKEMEDNRDKLLVIFAGYTKEMDQLFAMNSGISSRIGYTINFEDYTAEQLVNIFVNFSEKERFHFADDAKESLLAVFEEVILNADGNFGNGRTARQYFEKAKLVQSNRLATQPDQDIFELTQEDILELHSIM